MIGATRRVSAPRRQTSAKTGPRRRGAAARRRRRLRRPSLRVVLALGLLLALCGGAWLWVRNSSLVAVRQVTITGVSGPDAGRIDAALESAGRTMSTLNVRPAALRTAVAPYPVVKHLQVSTQFPHGMRIRVVEQVPVAKVTADGHAVAVASDGTLLHDGATSASLPSINVGVLPGGTHVTGLAAAEVKLLAAAPYRLLARIAAVTSDTAHGFIVELRNGPRIYFGGGDQLAAKWSAAVAVLGDPSSAGAVYIDVTEPQRPAAGSGSSTAAAVTGSTGSGAAAPVTGSTGSGAAAPVTGSTGSGTAATGSTGAGTTSSGGP